MALDRKIFADIGNARASSKSDNFKDGRGRALVLKNIYADMNDGPTFVAEVKVVSAAPKGDPALASFTPGKPHLPEQPIREAACNLPGAVIGWPQKVKKFKSAAGNVKAYVLALLGFNEADVSADDFSDAMVQLLNDDTKSGAIQPGRGMLVDFETYRQPTKSGPNAGQINTYVKWSHVPAGTNPDDADSNHPVQIAKRRAELDKTTPLQA